MSFLRKSITKDQSRDTGMAIVLLCLLLAPKRHTFLYVAMGVHVVNMIVPIVYKPLAYLWFGLSDVMGAVMSKVLLSIVFFFVVTPIAILRRLSGKDALKLRAFKASKESAMIERNHMFTAKDLESPY